MVEACENLPLDRYYQELVHINEVLAVKADRIETEEDKKKFAKAVNCWICKNKFNIDTDEIERLETKIIKLKEKQKIFKKASVKYNSI